MLCSKQVRYFDQWELLSLVTFRSLNSVVLLVSVSNYYIVDCVLSILTMSLIFITLADLFL